MTNKEKKDLALHGDPKRQAVDSLRGYVYQIWHSVHAWLELADEGILFLEGVEDFDIVDPGKATTVQVKCTTANITLRSPAVIDAITHYWQLRNAYPDKAIFFRFLTSSQIGIEKGQPFGPGVAGLTLWQHCSRESETVDKLRNFLLGYERLPEDLSKFLSSADSKVILEQLMLPITWETSSRDAGYVEQAIERKLILHGEKYGIPPSKSASVVNRLLKQAITRACWKAERFLDRALFLRLFEEETTERVPSHQLQALTKVVQETNPLLSALLGEHTGLSFQPVPLIQTGIPPLHAILAPRNRFVADLVTRLKDTGVLFLTGSTGMGKTTLAKLTAKNDGSYWCWLNLSSRDSAQLSEILRQLAVLIERKRIPVNVVLDDLDLSPAHSRQYEDYLGGLLYTVLGRSGRIIITGQKPLPERVSHLLGLDLKSVYSMPPFDGDEIAGLALQLGCLDEKVAQNWAKVILLHTKGHPQLVHARLLHLADARWPALKHDDLLKTPPDVVRERSEAREMLIEQLSEEQRELVYRLSIIGGLFRRDHAVTIGENTPPIPHPGDALDRLIGPWIEPFHREYYRLSPLLENAANQVWSKEKVQSLHADVARAILSCGKLTTLEAGSILLNAWVGRDGGTLAITIQGLLTSPENVWKSMANELSWLIYIGLDSKQAPFPENIFVNSAFRMLQFRIALQVEPKTASKIAEAWNKETTPHDPKESFLLERYLLCTHILIHYEVEIPPKQLLAYFVELAELERQIEGFKELFRNVESLPLGFATKGSFDAITLLFGFVIPRCSSVSFLNELFDALKKTPETVRKRMLNAFETIESQATLLLNAVWLGTANSDEKDWKSCIKVFERTIKLAMEWNVPPLAIAAARGLAIVYEEYSRDPAQAIAALDKVEALVGKSSVILDDERAKVFFHQERYEDALKIWERILPEWHPPTEHYDMMPMFACRNAGISATHIGDGDWQKAAYFFKDGSERSQKLKNQVFTIALIADTGFALWKASKYKESINLFVEVLQGLEQLPDPEKDLASFTLRKMVGHVLLWIENSLRERSAQELAEPRPGMCSNPDRSEKIRELPDTPLDFSWMHLSQIEHQLRLGASIFKRVYRRLIKSRFPSVRFFMAHLDVEHSFRRLEFELLPAQSDVLDAAYQAIQEHYIQGKEVCEESPTDMDNKRLPPFQMSETGLFFAALVSLSGADRMNPGLFEVWRKKAKGLRIYDSLTKWIDLAKTMLARETWEAFAIMADKDENRDSRLIGALKVGVEENVTPNEMFYAHTLLASDLLQGPWAKDVADYLARLFSRQWLKKTEFQAALISPRLTVPEIQAACKSEAGEIRKAAQILLAASNAVSFSIPQDIRTQLHNLTANH
jgi:tetratricopeptide (TPR) repeat protein